MSILERADRGPVWPGGGSLQGPHRVQAFAMCPQAEAFGYELHLRPIIEKLPTAVGTLFHAGAAYRYAARLAKKPEWFVYADGYEAIRACGYARPDYTDLALRIFAAYEEHYRGDDWRPVLVEHQFVVYAPNGEPYSCRTDLLTYDGRGDLWVVDHKSCGRLSKSVSAKYETDRQMLTNLALARALGHDVKGVLINEVSREMPYPQFQRQAVEINPSAYQSLWGDTVYYLDAMKAVRLSHPDPTRRPRNTGACQGKFGTCDFYGLCFGTDTLEMFKVPEDVIGGRLLKGT